jgi:hypothetical protein
MYGVWDGHVVSAILGSVELLAAVLVTTRIWSAFYGLLGSILSCCIFATTLSFLVTTPDLWSAVPQFPLPVPDATAAFILKDVFLARNFRDERGRGAQGDVGDLTRLFVPHRLDGVEPRGPPRRVDAEHQAGAGGDDDAEDDRVGRDLGGQAPRTLMRKAAKKASATPSMPPTPVSMAASVTNWPRMRRRRAPSARRTPISEVRSVTATNMMFMTPMPPMSRAMAQMPMETKRIIPSSSRTAPAWSGW